MKINKYKDSNILDSSIATLEKFAKGTDVETHHRRHRSTFGPRRGDYAENTTVYSPGSGFSRGLTLAYWGDFASEVDKRRRENISGSKIKKELRLMESYVKLNYNKDGTGDLWDCYYTAKKDGSKSGLKAVELFEKLEPVFDGIKSGQMPSSVDLTSVKNSKQKYDDSLALVVMYNELINECKLLKNKIKKSTSHLSDSINKHSKFDMTIKQADKISNDYYKDAVKGLSNGDSFMKTFYKEMSSEYNKKSEAKPHKRKDLMDFFYEEEHIMAQAHPNSIVVADAMGDGGLVENNIERHNKSKQIATKRPLANFLGNHN